MQSYPWTRKRDKRKLDNQDKIKNHLMIVTGSFALCNTKLEVLPRNIVLGNPIPRAPITI